ncbi:arsenate reductase/protein-tyrosine-phosphatase family protein [Streptomyces rishiriensis]|nr:hypothetical protein [Streptomyces rishiriensis]
MMRRVLIVCLGNYCRSPFAALALAHRGGTEVEVRSAGLIGKWEGEPAHMAMVKAAGRLGLDLTTHRARQITLEMMAWADTIVAMDTHVRDVLIDVCGESNQSKLAL